MKHKFSLVFLVLHVILLLNVEAADDEFIKTRGVQLMLNGSPYYANGFNAYWLMYFASDPSQRNKVSSTFQEATNHGLNIARTWAFSDGGYKPLQYSPGSYNEEMFQVYSLINLLFNLHHFHFFNFELFFWSSNFKLFYLIIF
jgi:mannan endo-1,4-beta-mannosidase